jgi:CubicO group peptidase (beta-lactamase class C family)
MYLTFKKSKCALILILLFSLSVNAQTKKYAADVEESIRQVESNLSGWVKTGENDSWSLAERMIKYHVNGVSIAVIHNFQIEWARGYGFADVSENRPVTENTLFQAASISKSLNSLGVLKLVQEKKLDLNTDINEYLVSWKFPYDEKSNNKKITLTNLLSHTAGLTVSGFPGYAKGDTLPTIKQIINGEKPANTRAIRSFNEPGKNFTYSGGGITISQMIVMDVTNQPYDVFMQKNVLDPLGMTSSSFTQPPLREKEKILATGYKADGKEVPGKYHIYPEQAAAGLWTNPVDLCKYVIETQLSFNGQSSKVLTPELTRLRVTPVSQDAALGTFVNSRVTGSSKYFNHNGGNEGFSCTAIGSLNEGNGVVIMTNSDNPSILEEIANSVAIVYKWKDYYLPEIKKVVSLDTIALDKYVGKYAAFGNNIELKKEGQNLMASIQDYNSWKLYFTSDSDFFVRELRGSMRFRIYKNNKVKGLSFNGAFAKKIE